MKLHYIDHLNNWRTLYFRTRAEKMWMRWLIQIDPMCWVEA